MRPIDADALIEKFAKEAQRTSDISFAQALMYVCTCLDCVPTIEQAKWIPAAERLPKHGEIVICNTLFFVEVMQWDERSEVWISKSSIHGKEYVDYWMPLSALPQPPKGDE